METVCFKGPLCTSDAFRLLKVEPGPGKDLLVLPGIPAVMQARQTLCDTDSAPFITTFGLLASQHNARTLRLSILSRTGFPILMRHVAQESAHVHGLISLRTDLKQYGIAPADFAREAKNILHSDAAKEAAEAAAALDVFERRMNEAAMTDNAGMMSELARAFGSGETPGVTRPRRIVAAGFDRLAPLHKRVLEEAERSGITTVQLCRRDTDTRNISLLSFPSLTEEAEFAALKMREMADEDGRITPKDFVVIMRDMSRGNEVKDALERGGLPVSLRAGARAEEASGISTLLRQFLLTAGSGFASMEFVRLVRHPLTRQFFGPGNEALEAARAMESALLKMGSRRAGGAFEELTSQLPDTAARKVTALAKMVSEHMPEDTSRESAAIEGLRRLVDKTGAHGAGEAARTVLREATFLCGMWDGEVSSWEKFSDFVSDTLNGSSRTVNTASSAASVTVMNALEARGTHYPAVFIPEFSEGSFPRSPGGKTVLGEAEKRIINGRLGVPALTTTAEYLERERLIWLSTVSCAGDSLNISFSKDRVSHFAAKMGRRVVDMGRGVPKSPYCADAVMAAEMARGGKMGDKTEKLLEGAGGGFFNFARRAVRGADAENQRMRPHGEFGRFEGITGGGTPERLSVSDVERVGGCPFVFFCSKTLGIERKPDIDTLPSPADTGRLYHSALMFLFSSGCWKKSGGDLRREIDGFLTKKETKNEFRRVPDAVWELHKQYVGAVLERLLAAERERIDKEGLKPALFEQKIETEIAGVKIVGKLDRMDYGTAGDVRVVDYKKGSVGGTFLARDRLQVPLYLSAVSKARNVAPQGGDYISVERAPERKSGNAESCEDARILAQSNINLITQGILPPFPGKKTDDFPYGGDLFPAKKHMCDSCSYSDVCRIKSGVTRSVPEGGKA